MTLDKIKDFQIKKSWIWLLYIDLILPAILFLLAYFTQSNALAKVYHNYGLFIASCNPNFSSFTGIVGLCIALFFLGKAIWRKDALDITLTLVIIIMNAVYYYFDFNYLSVPMLAF